VISLHLFEGRSHDEIATELGVTAATARQRYCRAVRRVGEAVHLMDLMTERGFEGQRQDALGLHRCQGTDAAEIAVRLRLPQELVEQWISQAEPLFRIVARDLP
jgi:DNA-directed RNA polymerase specialized sigma24 family protein